MYGLQATPTRPQTPTSYVDPRLKHCAHVFLRCDRIRKPLQPPFKVLSRSDMTFTILLIGEDEVARTDRLKAAFVEDTSSVSLNKTTTQTPAAIITANTPEIVSPTPCPNAVSSPDKPCPTSTTIRSGRCVRFPHTFIKTATPSSSSMTIRPLSLVALQPDRNSFLTLRLLNHWPGLGFQLK